MLFHQTQFTQRVQQSTPNNPGTSTTSSLNDIHIVNRSVLPTDDEREWAEVTYTMSKTVPTTIATNRRYSEGFQCTGDEDSKGAPLVYQVIGSAALFVSAGTPVFNWVTARGNRDGANNLPSTYPRFRHLPSIISCCDGILYAELNTHILCLNDGGALDNLPIWFAMALANQGDEDLVYSGYWSLSAKLYNGRDRYFNPAVA